MRRTKYMEKHHKYAVVVVHGIVSGTGDARREFSAALKENVRKAMSDLMYIPFEFENGGTRVIHYTPESYEPLN